MIARHVDENVKGISTAWFVENQANDCERNLTIKFRNWDVGNWNCIDTANRRADNMWTA